jgi:hypothetical protein
MLKRPPAESRRRIAWLPPVLLALVLAFVLVATARADTGDPGAVQALKKQFRGLQRAESGLKQEQRKLLEEQGQLADEIEKLKASEPGFIGRMRLERLLARNLEVSQRLDELAAQLAENARARAAMKENIYNAYTAEMERVVQQMKNTTDQRLAADLARRFYDLHTRREQWRSPTTAETDFSLFEVDVSDTGAPAELLANAQRLDDLVTKIRAAVKRIDKNLNQLRRELRLNAEMREMIHENDLFQEGTRFHTGDRTSGVRPPEQTPEPTPPPVQESGVHVPPIPATQGEPPGAERVAQSIQEEIRKLAAERAYLIKLAGKLSAKANDLRNKARQQQSRLGGVRQTMLAAGRESS